MKKMTIEQVIENIKKIKEVENIWEEIVISFGDYEFEGETSVFVESPQSNMSSFTPREGERHCAYINHVDAPIIYFTLEEVEEDVWSVLDAW